MRRVVDIVFAVVALTALLPVFAVVIVLIMIDSPGNPFYFGWRAAKGGRKFRMWKFRTMVKNADRIGPGITGSVDPRITRSGQFLRKTKIDEMPQLINLLTGELTIVGPRPEDPNIVAGYTPKQRRVMDFKPGVTGVGALHYTTNQVHRIPPDAQADKFYIEHLLDEKLQMEIEYEENRNAVTDIKVVWATVMLILRAAFPFLPAEAH